MHILLDSFPKAAGYKNNCKQVSFSVTGENPAAVKQLKHLMQFIIIPPAVLFLFGTPLLLSIVAMFYIYTSAKTRERLALIEKGMDPNLSRSNFWPQVGVITASFFAGMFVDDKLNAHYGPLMGFIFAGVALVIFHIFSRRSKNL